MFRNKKMVKNTSYHHALPFYISKRFVLAISSTHYTPHGCFSLIFAVFWHKFGINYHIMHLKRDFRWCELIIFITYNTQILLIVSKSVFLGVYTNLRLPKGHFLVIFRFFCLFFLRQDQKNFFWNSFCLP